MIGVIIVFETSLVVISYPGGNESHKGRPFAHKPSLLVTSWKCKVYINEDIYIADSKPTIVKAFVGHNSAAVIFNSLELGQLADEKDGSINVCHIEASKVVVVGYLQDLYKTLNEEHWTEHLNVLPRLRKLDVEVQIHNIDDLTSKT